MQSAKGIAHIVEITDNGASIRVGEDTIRYDRGEVEKIRTLARLEDKSVLVLYQDGGQGLKLKLRSNLLDKALAETRDREIVDLWDQIPLPLFQVLTVDRFLDWAFRRAHP